MKKLFVRRYLLALVALIAMANLLTFSPAYAKPKTQGVQEQAEYRVVSTSYVRSN